MYFTCPYHLLMAGQSSICSSFQKQRWCERIRHKPCCCPMSPKVFKQIDKCLNRNHEIKVLTSFSILYMLENMSQAASRSAGESGSGNTLPIALWRVWTIDQVENMSLLGNRLSILFAMLIRVFSASDMAYIFLEEQPSLVQLGLDIIGWTRETNSVLML